MAVTQWVEIYSAYSREMLEETLVKLRLAAGSAAFTAGGAGQQTWNKDAGVVTEQLQAATRVWNEQFGGGGNQPRSGGMDFSRLVIS
jgi:hypothetical protein